MYLCLQVCIHMSIHTLHDAKSFSTVQIMCVSNYRLRSRPSVLTLHVCCIAFNFAGVEQLKTQIFYPCIIKTQRNTHVNAEGPDLRLL